MLLPLEAAFCGAPGVTTTVLFVCVQNADRCHMIAAQVRRRGRPRQGGEFGPYRARHDVHPEAFSAIGRVEGAVVDLMRCDPIASTAGSPASPATGRAGKQRMEAGEMTRHSAPALTLTESTTTDSGQASPPSWPTSGTPLQDQARRPYPGPR